MQFPCVRTFRPNLFVNNLEKYNPASSGTGSVWRIVAADDVAAVVLNCRKETNNSCLSRSELAELLYCCKLYKEVSGPDSRGSRLMNLHARFRKNEDLVYFMQSQLDFRRQKWVKKG